MAQIMGCKQKNYYFLFNQRLFHNKNIMHLQMLDINQMQKIPITVSTRVNTCLNIPVQETLKKTLIKIYILCNNFFFLLSVWTFVTLRQLVYPGQGHGGFGA